MRKFRIECGVATASAPDTMTMDVHGKGKNVNLRIDCITRSMLANVPDLLLDLLEIAAYVYCADQRMSRGTAQLTNFGENWRRDLHFTIPVRDPALWQHSEVQRLLEDTLGFLSDDSYTFEFHKAKSPFLSRDVYFQDLIDASSDYDAVAMFSGGVDSFAGAVQDVVLRGRSVCLVGHSSATKVKGIQQQLVDGLKARGFERRVTYIPVWVTNENVRPNDHTQRTRSFLFACLGMVIAHMSGKDRFTFYENGVVSINPPVAGDIVGGRATRTTHPRVLRGLEELFSTLLERPVQIENPLQRMTKREVTMLVQEAGMADLLATTNSCTRPRTWTAAHMHCGACSQCIDRRFGILAASLGDHEPATNYKIDLLTADRSTSDDLRMAVSYVSFFKKVAATPKERFVVDFPEIVSAINSFPDISAGEAANRIYDLFQRQAKAVESVIAAGVKEHAEALFRNELPAGSLLSICFARNSVEILPSSDYDSQAKALVDRLSAPVFEFAIDETRQTVVFRSAATLTQANFRIVEQLLPDFRSAKKEGREVPFTPPRTLAKRLRISEPSLRTQIRRLREALEPLVVDLGLPLDNDSFIENRPHAGYRLNPAVRELSLADIRASTIPGAPPVAPDVTTGSP
ncbi:MAG: 7-cyano-7-deazaguanine synthase [Hyphomicrobium sp.]